MARKTPASRRPKVKAPRVAPSVYTPVTPPLAPTINAACALRLLRGLDPAPHSYASADWWQGTLDAQEATRATLLPVLAAAEAKVEAHNTRLVEAASLVSLPVVDVAETGILSISPADIMAEARRRKNRGKRGHKSANRWLAYACPICTVEKERPNGTIERSNTVRCSADNRLIICNGTHDKPHDQAIMYLIEESQPAYRLDDKYQTEENAERVVLGVEAGHTLTQSQTQLAARKAKRQDPDPIAALLPPASDHSEIPF